MSKTMSREEFDARMERLLCLLAVEAERIHKQLAAQGTPCDCLLLAVEAERIHKQLAAQGAPCDYLEKQREQTT